MNSIQFPPLNDKSKQQKLTTMIGTDANQFNFRVKLNDRDQNEKKIINGLVEL
jgi:lipid A disaccharide synthetase